MFRFVLAALAMWTVTTAAPAHLRADEPDTADADDSTDDPKQATEAQKERDREQLASIEAFLRAHVEHANSGDLDAYLADFVDSRNDKDLLRAYAERVLREHRPTISISDVELEHTRHDRAKVHVTQVTRWTDAEGRARTDRVQMRYSLQKKTTDGVVTWRIVGTTRERDR